jgi:pyruvate-formate lyase-activating enzyme
LTSKLFPLIHEKGLSAAVYTQTTDVEVEVNGLMTYDRELIKMDLKKISEANRQRLTYGSGAVTPADKTNSAK